MRMELSETEIIKGIYEQTDKKIQRLNDSIAKHGAKLDEYKEKEIPVDAIAKELFAQYPDITHLSLTRGSSVEANHPEATEQIVAIIGSENPIDTEQHDRIERWLKVRLNNENVAVVNEQK